MTKHTHKYERIRLGKNKRVEFKCVIPGCVHHIAPELVVGRLSICFECGDEFVMTKYNVKKHAKPRCINCIAGGNKIKKILELIG